MLLAYIETKDLPCKSSGETIGECWWNYQTFPAILKSSTKHKRYQSALNQFGYDWKLQSQPPNDKNEDKIKSSKNRKGNIICFNPPFSKNVSNNIGKYFLLLIQKSFPNNNINIIK